MAKRHENIPNRTPLVGLKGLITHPWHQFLNKIFGDIYTRLNALEERVSTLEAIVDDHETRISSLEGP